MTTALMLQLLLVALGAGVIAGTLAGLMGIGGGLVIVPALYFALSQTAMDPGLIMQMAVGTSLATIIFTALSSARGHYLRGAVDMHLLKIWAPSILAGVVLGGVLAAWLSGLVLMVVFVTVAALVGLDMILRSPAPTVSEGHFSKPVWAGLGVFAGAVSSMMGIGGGSVCVPILSFLGYDIRKAVGTASAIGLVIGAGGALTYAITGFGIDGRPPLSLGFISLPAVAAIVPMTVIFARVGVRLAHSLPRRALRAVFGVFLLLMAGRMAMDLVALLRAGG